LKSLFKLIEFRRNRHEKIEIPLEHDSNRILGARIMKKKSISIAVFGFLLVCQPILTQTWSNRKRLTWTINSSGFPVAAAYSGGRIHLAWVEAVPPYTYGEIYYKRTTDYGTSWNLVKRLTWNSGKSKSGYY